MKKKMVSKKYGVGLSLKKNSALKKILNYKSMANKNIGIDMNAMDRAMRESQSRCILMRNERNSSPSLLSRIIKFLACE